MQITLTLDPDNDADVRTLLDLTNALGARPANPAPAKKTAAPKAKPEVVTEAAEPEAEPIDDGDDEEALTIAIDEAVEAAKELLKNTKIKNRRDIVEDALAKAGVEKVTALTTMEQVSTFREALA